MKKMNHKGFTMVELLATILILGILMSFAMMAYTRNRDATAMKAFKLMPENVLSAAEEYYMDHISEVKKNPANSNEYSCISIKDLVCDDYLEETHDPFIKTRDCYGVACITKVETKDRGVDTFSYKVYVACSHDHNECITFPGKNSANCSDISFKFSKADQLNSEEKIVCPVPGEDGG